MQARWKRIGKHLTIRSRLVGEQLNRLGRRLDQGRRAAWSRAAEHPTWAFPAVTGTLAILMLLLLIIWQSTSKRTPRVQTPASAMGSAKLAATGPAANSDDPPEQSQPTGNEPAVSTGEPEVLVELSAADEFVRTPELVESRPPLKELVAALSEEEHKEPSVPPNSSGWKEESPFQQSDSLPEAPVAAADDDAGAEPPEPNFDLELAIQQVLPPSPEPEPDELTETFTVSSQPAAAETPKDSDLFYSADLHLVTDSDRLGTSRWKVALPPEDRAAADARKQSGEQQTTVALLPGSADDFAQTIVQTPRLRLRMTAPRQVLKGKVFLLQFEIENVGSAASRPAVLRLDLPSNLNYLGLQRLDHRVDALQPGDIGHAYLSVLADKLGQARTKAEILANGDTMDAAAAEIVVVASRADDSGPAGGNHTTESSGPQAVSVRGPSGRWHGLVGRVK